MEPVTSKILLTVGLKIVTPVFKLLKSKLEKELYIYGILRRRNAIKIKSDFESVYLETLYQLIEVKKKNKDLVKLFELHEVVQAFKNEIYKNNNWAFEIELDSNLHTNPKLRSLKKIDVNIKKEINEFKSQFKLVINTTREPKELEDHEALNKIKDNVSKLLDTKKLNDKFGTNIELSNQVLFSDSETLPLSEHISKREKLVETLISNYHENTWLAINGSISTGKSQLSVLLARQMSQAIYWINLRELNSQVFIIKLFTDLSSFLSVPIEYELTKWQQRIIDKIDNNSLIILDDLPKLDIRSQTFNKFISFLKASNEKGIKFLSTSNFELPLQLKDFFEKKFIKEITIPPLNEEEITDILNTYDLDVVKVNFIKKLISPISAGHPIIVKAICEYLNQKKWIVTDEEFSDIFKDNYSLELNEDTYEILKKTLPDENTRNLLYRLNTIIGAFSSDEVITVSECSPMIVNPIERFSSSIGLWIQKRDSNNFEVSPLLKRLKTKDLGTQLQEKINFTLGKKILDRRKLNQFDASKAISYFVAAKSFNDAGFVLTLVLNEALKLPELYFEWGINLYWYSTPLPQEMDLFLQMYIRVLQVLLNQQEKKDVTFLISDLENISEIASKKGINVGSAHLLLSNYFATKDSKKSLHYLMSGNDQYNALFKEYGETPKLNLRENFEAMIWGAIINIETIDEVNNWFATVKTLTKEQIESLRKSENIDFGSMFIFKNIYDKEENKQKEEQNWNKIIEIFKQIRAEAQTLNLELINANGARYIINILSEKLDNVEEAFQFATQCLNPAPENQTAQFLIYDAIGRQLFYSNKIDEATSFIAKAVEIQVSDIYTEKLDTLLVISQILGIKDRKIAQFYSEKAKIFAMDNKFTSDLLRSKVIGEYAISIYLNGNIKEAIYCLEEGYQILLDSYNIKTEYHIIILRYGHVLNYWNQILTKGKPPTKEMFGEEYAVPDRGMFLSSYKKELVDDIYFNERRFNVSFLFFTSFEAMLDYEMSRKWAYNNLAIHQNLELNVFSIVLSQSIVYLIIDYKYIEAAEVEINIIDTNTKVTRKESDSDTIIENRYLKEIIENRPGSSITGYDETLVEFVLVPIMINFIGRYSGEQELIVENINHIEELIFKIEDKFKDRNFVNSIVSVTSCIKNKNKEIIKELNEIGENYKGEFSASLMLIVYLYSSIYVSSKDALRFHFALIGRLDILLNKFSSGAYNYILIPFLENFWFHRIEKVPEEFCDLTFWVAKSKKFYTESKPKNKVKNLFRILVHHLNYRTTITEDDWLEN